MVFRVVMPCSDVTAHQRPRGACCLHLMLKMEAACPPKGWNATTPQHGIRTQTIRWIIASEILYLNHYLIVL